MQLQTTLIRRENFSFMAQQASPPVQIDTLSMAFGDIFVIRDDVLPGGTKQRAAIPFVSDKAREGLNEFVYASPFCGFAQVALAAACGAVGVRCTLFCETVPGLPSGELSAHAFTDLAASYGAKIHLRPNLADAERSAAKHANLNSRRFHVPLGFDCDEFRRHLASAVKTQWARIKAKVKCPSYRLWVPVGSGTLTGVLRATIAPSFEILAVDVHVLPPEDDRLVKLTKISGVTVIGADQKFSERAAHLPPINSNIHYDAKLWQVICSQGQAGDIWWNVAR